MAAQLEFLLEDPECQTAAFVDSPKASHAQLGGQLVGLGDEKLPSTLQHEAADAIASLVFG